jgi:hypothetical protein
VTQNEAIIKNPAWDAADIERAKLMLCHRLARVLDIDIDAIRRGVIFSERPGFDKQVWIVASFAARPELRVAWPMESNP